MSDIYNLTIKKAKFETSKKGNSMLHITFITDGEEKINHYITFLSHMPDFTNRLLNDFFNAFGIATGNFELDTWTGLTGKAALQDSEWNGKIYKKVHYFVRKKHDIPEDVQKVIDQIKLPTREEEKQALFKQAEEYKKELKKEPAAEPVAEPEPEPEPEPVPVTVPVEEKEEPAVSDEVHESFWLDDDEFVAEFGDRTNE